MTNLTTAKKVVFHFRLSQILLVICKELTLTLFMCCIKLTVLASSGIDYDIKLWTPSAKEPMEPKDKDEVCYM